MLGARQAGTVTTGRAPMQVGGRLGATSVKRSRSRQRVASRLLGIWAFAILQARTLRAPIPGRSVENAYSRFPYFLKHNVADTTVTLQPVGGHEASAILRTIIAIPLLC